MLEDKQSENHKMRPKLCYFQDFEVLLAEPLIKYLPTRSKNFLQKYCAPFYGPVLFMAFSMTQLVCRCGRFLSGKQEIRPENLMIFLEFAIALILAPSLLVYTVRYFAEFCNLFII